MINKTIATIVLLFVVGCGFKGPLYMPNKNIADTEIACSHFTYN